MPTGPDPRPVKKAKKAKLENSILSKSKRFTEPTTTATTPSPVPKRPHPPPDTDLLDPSSSQQSKKKPRHASVEGQRFLKEKEKIRAREWAGSSLTAPTKSTTTTTPSKSKKKSKKSKKKKVKTTTTGEVKVQSSFLPAADSSDRCRREALAYLQLWQGHRDVWKFNKLKQVWLLKHAVDTEAVDEPCFASLLEYVASIKGVARDKTRIEMGAHMAAFEAKFGTGEKSSVFSVGASTQAASEGDKVGYERARQVIQMLSE